MTNPQQVNIKNFPENPTPEKLYLYFYNRVQRRKHTTIQKQDFQQKLWNNYLQWKKQQDEALLKIKTQEE